MPVYFFIVMFVYVFYSVFAGMMMVTTRVGRMLVIALMMVRINMIRVDEHCNSD